MGRAHLGEGLKAYYQAKIEELEIQARDKQHNLRRLEAQRNDLNTKGGPQAIASPLSGVAYAEYVTEPHTDDALALQ